MNQRAVFSSTTVGVPKKKRGRMPVAVRTCHSPNTAKSNRSRYARRRTPGLSMLLLRIPLEDLRLEQLPDVLVQLEEPLPQPHFRHVARPRQTDCELADRARRRPGGQPE